MTIVALCLCAIWVVLWFIWAQLSGIAEALWELVYHVRKHRSPPK